MLFYIHHVVIPPPFFRFSISDFVLFTCNYYNMRFSILSVFSHYMRLGSL